jgi:hypothetical protein
MDRVMITASLGMIGFGRHDTAILRSCAAQSSREFSLDIVQNKLFWRMRRALPAAGLLTGIVHEDESL